MTLQADQFARLLPTDRQQMEVQANPVQLTWEWPNLTTADGHALSLRFSCSMRAPDAPADRQLLREALLSNRNEATLKCLAALFEESLRATASALAAKICAKDLGDQTHSQWQEKLASQANRVAFAAGLAVLWPVSLLVQCPTLQRLSRVQQTNDLLVQIENVRQAHPDLVGGALLNFLTESDRPAVLASMLLAEGRNGATALAVAGDRLIRISLDAPQSEAPQSTQPQPKIEQQQIDPAIGPLRSVSIAKIAGENALILGGNAGLTILGHQEQTYLVPDSDSLLGFSHALLDGNYLVARHGGIGVLSWQIGQPAPACLLASNEELAGQGPASGELALLAEGQYLISSGPRIWALRHGDISPLDTADYPAPVIRLIQRDADVIAVHSDGSAQRIERPSGKIVALFPPRGTPGTITTAGAIPMAGSCRLLLAGQDNLIRCVGLEDGIVSEFRSGHVGLRMVSGGAGWVMAVSGDRQRLIFWPAHDGRQCAAEIHVTSFVRHRIAGIAMLEQVATRYIT
jgi:hypothetical protein